MFPFPENMTFFFRQKMKDVLSQKIHGNMMFSSNALKRRSFQKIALEYDLSFTTWKDGIFLTGKFIFLWMENKR